MHEKDQEQLKQGAIVKMVRNFANIRSQSQGKKYEQVTVIVTSLNYLGGELKFKEVIIIENNVLKGMLIGKNGVMRSSFVKNRNKETNEDKESHSCSTDDIYM